MHTHAVPMFLCNIVSCYVCAVQKLPGAGPAWRLALSGSKIVMRLVQRDIQTLGPLVVPALRSGHYSPGPSGL